MNHEHVAGFATPRPAPGGGTRPWAGPCGGRPGRRAGRGVVVTTRPRHGGEQGFLKDI